jgi:hypothetical protein
MAVTSPAITIEASAGLPDTPPPAVMRQHHRRVDISVEISGPHDFTVRRHVVRLVDIAASIASRANES